MISQYCWCYCKINKWSNCLSWCKQCFPTLQRVAPIITYTQTTESTETPSDNSTGSYGTGSDTSTDAYSTEAFAHTTDDGVTTSGDSVSKCSPIYQEIKYTTCASYRAHKPAHVCAHAQPILFARFVSSTVYKHDLITIIIIRQPLCPWLGEGLSMSSPNDPVLCCPLLQYLSRSSLHRLAGLPCRLFLSWSLSGDTRGPSVVFEAGNMPCHFIFLTVFIISMTIVLSLTQMLVLLSVYLMLRILLFIMVCAVASLLCACLVSVQVSAPYVTTGSTQELYTCLFRQMARWLLKISGFWRMPTSLP